jgi:hypothetical protein
VLVIVSRKDKNRRTQGDISFKKNDRLRTKIAKTCRAE